MSKAKKYDVVIVGAGIVGSVLAKWLTAQGKSVALLEAGKGDAETYLGYQKFVDQSFVLPSRPNAPYPQNDNAGMPGIPYPQANEENPKAWMGGQEYWIQEGPVAFGSDYARTLGGTSLHWLGVSLRHVPNDFHIDTNYEVGRNWPVDYHEMEKYYRRAEYELGVAADVTEQTYLGVEFEEGYVYPMVTFPMTYLDTVLEEDIRGMEFKVKSETFRVEIIPTPQARNAMPNPLARFESMTAPEGPIAWKAAHAEAEDPLFRPVGNPTKLGFGTGDRCEGNSSCIPICPVQAKYNSTKSLAKAKPKFLELRTQCVASRILTDVDNRKVVGIEYLRYKDSSEPKHSKKVISGEIYVIAAHAVETAKLCLISNVGNKSDQMGRNLMDHPYLNFSGYYRDKKIWGYRGPDVTGGMPKIRDGQFRTDHAAFRTDIGNWGWVFPKGSPAAIVDEMVEKDGLYGNALREALEEQGPRHMRIGFLMEQLPDPNNRVVLEDKYGQQHLDPMGIPRPVIHYDVDDYTLAGMEVAHRFAEELFDTAGISIQDQVQGSGTKKYDGKTYQFWGSGHLIGTHVMGNDPQTSVVDSYQQTHDHENLFLAGCGSHPTSATANPTLTMTAMAFRTLDRILEKLNG